MLVCISGESTQLINLSRNHDYHKEDDEKNEGHLSPKAWTLRQYDTQRFFRINMLRSQNVLFCGNLMTILSRIEDSVFCRSCDFKRHMKHNAPFCAEPIWLSSSELTYDLIIRSEAPMCCNVSTRQSTSLINQAEHGIEMSLITSAIQQRFAQPQWHGS